jgi:hypothetical protein
LIIKNNILRGGVSNAISVSGFDTSNRIVAGTINISGNDSAVLASPVYIANTNADRLIVEHNTSTTNTTNAHGEIIQTVTSTIGSVFCNHNKVANTQAAYYSTSITATNYIEFTNNYGSNYLNNGGVILNATDILYANNFFASVIGDIVLTGRYFDKIFGNGNVETWGTAAPTTGRWNRGDIWKQVDASASAAPGGVCVFVRDTTMTATEPIGETSMAITSGYGSLNGDVIGVTQDDGTIHWTTIASGGGTDTVVLTVGLTVATSATKPVYIIRWKAMASLGA